MMREQASGQRLWLWKWSPRVGEYSLNRKRRGHEALGLGSTSGMEVQLLKPKLVCSRCSVPGPKGQKEATQHHQAECLRRHWRCPEGSLSCARSVLNPSCWSRGTGLGEPPPSSHCQEGPPRNPPQRPSPVRWPEGEGLELVRSVWQQPGPPG